MKRTVLRLLFWMNLLFAVIAYLSGCATTKPTIPNTPFAGPYPQCFNELSAKNPLLANELAKLPEFQDGVNVQEEKALDALIELYANNPKVFNNAFEKMYQVGIPDFRKFCSPLQAVFWLAEDGKIKQINELLQKYSLNLLLENAWIFNKHAETTPYIKTLHLTDDQIKSVVSKLNKERQELFAGIPLNSMNKILLMQYKDEPGFFPEDAEKIIESALKEKPNPYYKHHVRWKDFNTVLDRLNSPELVWYYIANNIVYKRGYVNTPYEVFKKKKAHCISSSHFGRLALKRAGYKTFIRHVAWGPWGHADHAGSGIVLDDGRFFLVVDFKHHLSRPLSGPYKDISEVDEVLACGHKISGRMWGSYFEPGQ